MPTLQEQIATAKAAGYSDDDIAKHLSARADLAPKIKQATDAGYKPDQIVAHLAGSAPVTAPAPATPAAKPKTSVLDDMKQVFVDGIAGQIRGAGSIGATIAYPWDKAQDIYYGDRGPNMAGLVTGKAPESRNEQRRRQMDEGLSEMGADINSMVFKGGKLGGEIAGTAGAGGLVGQGIIRAAPVLARAGVSAPTIQALAKATSTGGFSTGAPAALTMGAKAANMGVRMAGGGIAGLAGAAAIDPKNAGMGAAVGAALPPVLTGTSKVAGYLGRSIYSLAQPFTTAGQERIAGKVINRFAEGAPATVNATEIVPGSMPTLAEATGNAGIGRLQSTARDLAPNRFVERETANAAARAGALDDIAGDAAKLDFFKASRSDAAADLYGDALRVNTAANMTPKIQAEIGQLLKRPSITQAAKQAKSLALERGETVGSQGSMSGLHDMKTVLDDEISVALRAGKNGQAKALLATKEKLLGVMEKISPKYKEASATFAEMSKPINQMEVLQGFNLVDAQGGMMLSKVQRAIDAIEKQASAPGAKAAKSITSAQIGTLQAIRDDLLRKSSAGAGKSAGATTFQNFGTDNIVSTMLPGKVGEIVGGKAGTFINQIAQLMYSKPNAAIKERMIDLMLDPKAAQAAMAAARGGPSLGGPGVQSIRDLSNSAGPAIYRTAPVLSSSR